MNGNRFAICLVAGVLLGSTAALQAQSNTPPAPQIRPAPGQQPAINGISVGGPYGVMNDQQRASYLALMKEQRPRIAELQAKLRSAHQDFVAATSSANFDEGLAKKKAMAAAEIEAEMAVIRAKVVSQVQPPLTPEQYEKIKNDANPNPARPLMRPMDRPQRHDAPAPAAPTNRDENGLPPKQ
jgi:Spy/CpxP family protein refolding chaperone